MLEVAYPEDGQGTSFKEETLGSKLVFYNAMQKLKHKCNKIGF